MTIAILRSGGIKYFWLNFSDTACKELWIVVYGITAIQTRSSFSLTNLRDERGAAGRGVLERPNRHIVLDLIYSLLDPNIGGRSPWYNWRGTMQLTSQCSSLHKTSIVIIVSLCWKIIAPHLSKASPFLSSDSTYWQPSYSYRSTAFIYLSKPLLFTTPMTDVSPRA